MRLPKVDDDVDDATGWDARADQVHGGWGLGDPQPRWGRIPTVTNQHMRISWGYHGDMIGT